MYKKYRRLLEVELEQAARNGDTYRVQLLARLGVNVNTKNPHNGRTPLHVAAMFGRCDSAKCLLDAGADPILKDNLGRTPFSLAEKYQKSHKNHKIENLFADLPQI